MSLANVTGADVADVPACASEAPNPSVLMATTSRSRNRLMADSLSTRGHGVKGYGSGCGSFQSEVRGAGVIHEHFHRIEQVVTEIAAQQRELPQQIVRDRDDVAADGVGLDDVEQLARAVPDQLD